MVTKTSLKKKPKWVSFDAYGAAFGSGKNRIWIQSDLGRTRQEEAFFHGVLEIICELLFVRVHTVVGKSESDFFELPLFRFDHDKFRDLCVLFYATIVDNELF